MKFVKSFWGHLFTTTTTTTDDDDDDYDLFLYIWYSAHSVIKHVREFSQHNYFKRSS